MMRHRLRMESKGLHRIFPKIDASLSAENFGREELGKGSEVVLPSRALPSTVW